MQIWFRLRFFCKLDIHMIYALLCIDIITKTQECNIFKNP